MAEDYSYKPFDFHVNTHGEPMPKIGAKAPSVSDTQLWKDFQSGDEAAYATIYKNNVSRLYSYGLKLVGEKDLVKDSIQDLFVELWEAKDRLSEVRSIKSYLYTSIRRKLILKKSERRRLFSQNYESVKAQETVPSSEINLIEKQQFNNEREELIKALAKLNNKQREIVYLKFYSHLSYRDISEIMSLDKKGTYNLMAHTIKLLRQYLGTIFLIAFILP